MPPFAQRFAHIPTRTVRFWALLDLAVIWMLVTPVLAPYFMDGLYAVNGWMGGVAIAPSFETIHLLFACLTGSLASMWVVLRLIHPIGLLAVVDACARAWISLLLVWLVLGFDGPRVLWLFVLTEFAGTVGQLRAASSRRH